MWYQAFSIWKLPVTGQTEMETEEVSQDSDNKDIAVEVNVVVSHPYEWKDR